MQSVFGACRRMPTSDLVRYSGPKSRELQVKSDSSSFGSGGEDWITKKRVETKTVKTQEKRIQRQVGNFYKTENMLLFRERKSCSKLNLTK